MQIVLFEPEIPPNTGSVARLCAATLTPLHLIEPLGFKIDDKHLKRAGLDYWEFVDLRVHESWDDFLSAMRPEMPRSAWSSTSGSNVRMMALCTRSPSHGFSHSTIRMALAHAARVSGTPLISI